MANKEIISKLVCGKRGGAEKRNTEQNHRLETYTVCEPMKTQH